MVTFALPGDHDGDGPSSATPRARAPLPFAQRGISGSPYGSFKPRAGTPHTRKILLTRDDVPASSLSRSTTAPRGNLFRSSTVSDSSAPTPFSPTLGQSPLPTKVFAPGATPVASRVQREHTAHATPRGVAAKAKDKELFPMSIPDPPRELTGQALAQKVPKDWDPKGSIYADQFLSHLCPAEFDENQRRQFFCILDLRRLKYAADEIFCKKGWKLNVLNFAKEFEKSRSIIMLRYGLYEFQNVKPSKDVLKRWRREHGLPDPEEEETTATPTKPRPSTKKKRKASDDDETSNTAKRRAPVHEESEPVTASDSSAQPIFAGGLNKRKASISGDSESTPAKIQKPASGARSLFEKAANKASTTPSATPMKTNPFASKNTGGDLRRSVLGMGNKADGNSAASTPGNNIFGYLSDKSSARNSGTEADAESETDSESEDSAEIEKPKPKASALANAIETSTPSAAGTRESTPSRSLFDRITKDDEGQPLRAPTPTEAAIPTPAPPVFAPAPVKDQTWNPSSTPLKFAPTASSTQPSSLFGGAPTSAPSSSIFSAAKTVTPSNLFGAVPPAPKETVKEKSTEESNKDGESDKENDSQTSNKPTSEPKASPTPSLFGAPFLAPKTEESSKAPEPVKPALTGLFGASSTPAPAGLFGTATKPADSSSAPSTFTLQPSGLFGAKSSDTTKATVATINSPLLFGASSTKEPAKDTASSSIFGGNATTSTATNIFGSTGTAPAPTSNLFGGAKATTPPPASAAPSAPAFSFGSTTNGTAKPNGSMDQGPKLLFGIPQTPAPAPTSSMADGSPMKQDDKSPAKPIFGGNIAPSSGAGFVFGGGSQSAPSTNIFGGASNSSATTGISFGGTTATAPASAGGSFNFSFGGGDAAASTPSSTSTSFTNPFASGSQDAAGVKSTSFSFGGSSTPATGGSSSFVFGGSNNTSAAPSGGIFGSQGNTNGASATAPVFSGFGAGSSQPAAPSNIFGNSTSNAGPTGPSFLQPPPSTGTNTPFTLGGSSLATTPANGTPEPSAADASKTSGQASDSKETTGGDGDDGVEKHEQINLTGAVDEGEEVLHEVRAKILKFVPVEEGSKSKSPWSTQGVGALRLLSNKETKAVRLLLRAEPRGHIALNRSVLPDLDYKAESKYVKLTTSNESGDGLETWMIQVKTKEMANELAKQLEDNKGSNKK